MGNAAHNEACLYVYLVQCWNNPILVKYPNVFTVFNTFECVCAWVFEPQQQDLDATGTK